MRRTPYTGKTNSGTRTGRDRFVKAQYDQDEIPNPGLENAYRGPFTSQPEYRLEKVEKHLHTSCGNIERILVRVAVFGFFLYGLWRIVEAVFRSHP